MQLMKVEGWLHNNILYCFSLLKRINPGEKTHSQYQVSAKQFLRLFRILALFAHSVGSIQYFQVIAS